MRTVTNLTHMIDNIQIYDYSIKAKLLPLKDKIYIFKENILRKRCSTNKKYDYFYYTAAFTTLNKFEKITTKNEFTFPI